MYFIAFLSAKQMAIISRLLIWSWAWSSDQWPWKDCLSGSRWSHSSRMTGIREQECSGLRRMNGHSSRDVIGVHLPYQMELNRVVDLNVMINWKNVMSPDNRHIWSGRMCCLPRSMKSAAALSMPKRERKVRAITWTWERNSLIVRSMEPTRSCGTLTIFCCVRNSIPINVNFWAGIKSDFFRFGIKPRLHCLEAIFCVRYQPTAN